MSAFLKPSTSKNQQGLSNTNYSGVLGVTGDRGDVLYEAHRRDLIYIYKVTEGIRYQYGIFGVNKAPN